MKIRTLISIIALGLSLVRCSGGGSGEEPAATHSRANDPTTADPTEFLVATPAGLWRGLTNGQGGIVFERPNLQREDVFLGDGRVYYNQLQPVQVPAEFDLQDIWTVNADGTGSRPLVNTPNDDRVRAVSGPWAFYETGLYVSGITTEWRSYRGDTGQHTLLTDVQFNNLVILAGTRAVFLNLQDNPAALSSVNFDGTDTRGYNTNGSFTGVSFADPALIYAQQSGLRSTQLFSVPLAGGSPTPLDDGRAYTYYAGQSSGRVVYQWCKIPANDPDGEIPIGPCNVHSVNADGSGLIVLASHSANESVQGIIGNQVIIRRNLSGDDQLIAANITDGTQRLVATLTDSEFVQLVADDLIILRRPSGTWSLDLNGTLRQLGPTPGDYGHAVVGNAVCYNAGLALYCAPLNGSGPEVRIDRNGKIVGAL